MTWGSNPEPDPPETWLDWLPMVVIGVIFVLVLIAGVCNAFTAH